MMSSLSGQRKVFKFLGIDMPDQDKEIQCIFCSSNDCELYFEKKYNGIRGKCNSCNSNWPES